MDIKLSQQIEDLKKKRASKQITVQRDTAAVISVDVTGFTPFTLQLDTLKKLKSLSDKHTKKLTIGSVEYAIGEDEIVVKGVPDADKLTEETALSHIFWATKVGVVV
jgi:hypothetical protein